MRWKAVSPKSIPIPIYAAEAGASVRLRENSAKNTVDTKPPFLLLDHQCLAAICCRDALLFAG
jgi:hypothetical protein